MKLLPGGFCIRVIFSLVISWFLRGVLYTCGQVTGENDFSAEELFFKMASDIFRSGNSKSATSVRTDCRTSDYEAILAGAADHF
jgi:hypothetical protein